VTRTLYVLRHGKSDRDLAYSSDAERPLKRRGRRSARSIGRFLARIDEKPELVIASPALRTKTTAELAAEEGAWTAPIRSEPRLYDSRASTMLEVLRAIEDQFGRACLVGHEPSCSELVALLCGGAPPAFPTAALACIELPSERWSRTEPRTGTLQWLVTPRLIDPLADTDEE
jgi:phosphohistidine phosphatase